MDNMTVWNLILTLVVPAAAWYAKSQSDEVKRIQILLNITREEYVKKAEMENTESKILEALRRLEDKVDRISEGR